MTQPIFEAKRRCVSSTITSQPLFGVCALNKAKDGISEMHFNRNAFQQKLKEEWEKKLDTWLQQK